MIESEQVEDRDLQVGHRDVSSRETSVRSRRRRRVRRAMESTSVRSSSGSAAGAMPELHCPSVPVDADALLMCGSSLMRSPPVQQR